MICLPGTLFCTILYQNLVVKWNVPLNDLSPWYIVLYYSSPKSDRKVDTPAERIPSLAHCLYLFGPGAVVKWVLPQSVKNKVSDRRVAPEIEVIYRPVEADIFFPPDAICR